MATLGGQVTLAGVELKTQSWYMAFQVIQVFLITTFSSGAASSAAQIISNPSSATTLLAENLPKASNFFISYLILQGMGIAASQLLNIGALVMLTVVGKFLDKSPRKMFKRYITLGGLGWGSLYPKVGNFGIIGTSPSLIYLENQANTLKQSPTQSSHHSSSVSPPSASRSSTSPCATTLSTS